jgi:hypothetical protein
MANMLSLKYATFLNEHEYKANHQTIKQLDFFEYP